MVTAVLKPHKLQEMERALLGLTAGCACYEGGYHDILKG